MGRTSRVTDRSLSAVSLTLALVRRRQAGALCLLCLIFFSNTTNNVHSYESLVQGFLEYKILSFHFAGYICLDIYCA
jgi:hypothetical protein